MSVCGSIWECEESLRAKEKDKSTGYNLIKLVLTWTKDMGNHHTKQRKETPSESSAKSPNFTKLTKFSAFAFTDTAITKDDVKPILEAEIEARKQKVKLKEN